VSTGDNRSVEFDQYPSELMNGVTVYKTPDAASSARACPARIDMQTVRPLDYASRVAVSAPRYQTTRWARPPMRRQRQPHQRQLHRQSSTARSALDRLLAPDTPIQENQVGLYEPWKPVGRTSARASGRRLLLRRHQGPARTGECRARRRDGHGAVPPVERWTSTLDLFHSEATQEDTANQFEVNLGDYNGGFRPGLHITNAQVNGNDTFTGGVASACIRWCAACTTSARTRSAPSAGTTSSTSAGVRSPPTQLRPRPSATS
jgi:hypothetical protein